MKRVPLIGGLLVVAALLAVPGGSVYYEWGGGKGCQSCHEMQQPSDRWSASTHRNMSCGKCHGNAFTLDASFHWNNVKRLYAHLRGDLPEQIAFDNNYVQAMTAECRGCHQQEYAAWSSGPHGSTYGRIFLDKKYNSANMLMDDCLRCHGMHFEGGIADLVTPIDRQGPWRVVPAKVESMPSMPCLACHDLHREGQPLKKLDAPGPSQELARPSLAFFDRRTRLYVPVAELSVPAVVDGVSPVKMSKDQRQALCYQCHAPDYTMQAGSGDDRTGLGVHEGISCLACHAQHGQTTRASCATCHPKMSNCGLDVETMDTSFASKGSKHNIHRVKCADCHPKGLPRPQNRSQIGLQ